MTPEQSLTVLDMMCWEDSFLPQNYKYYNHTDIEKVGLVVIATKTRCGVKKPDYPSIKDKCYCLEKEPGPKGSFQLKIHREMWNGLISFFNAIASLASIRPMVDLTDHKNYTNQDEEFVMCHKIWPFAVVLIPLSLQTPTSTFEGSYLKFLEGMRVMNFWKNHENPFNVLGHYHF